VKDEDELARPALRLIGPPQADGEYVGLRDGDRGEEIVHLHDYERLYEVPGLYEHIVQELLGCVSPQFAAQGLALALTRLELDPAALTLLDLGAGTGLVGELLRELGIGNVVGLDTLAAARAACLHDRPAIYRDYLVGDLAKPTPQLLLRLRDHHLTGLVSAGAFGGTHAPATALVRAIDLLPAGAPVVFTIDERWMQVGGPDGFRAPVAGLLASGALRLLERSRFRHRLTTGGAPIQYELLIAATG
jgi:SAM-dependent methyltransferase